MSQTVKPAALGVLTGVAATLALFFAYLWVPLAGVLGALAAPFPALYCSLKHGRTAGVLTVAASAGLLAAFSAAESLLFLLQTGIISLLLAELLRRGIGVGRAVAATVAAAAVAAGIAAAAYAASAGTTLHSFVSTGIREGITQSAEMYRKAGLKGEDLQTLEQGLQQTADILSLLYPGLLLLFLALIAATCVYLAMKWRQRLPPFPAVEPFPRYRNREFLVWLLIAAGFSLLLKDQAATFVASNVLLVVLSLYFVQGLAVITNFFARYSVSRPWRFLFYIFLAVQPYLSIGITLMGLFDLWVDFRKPRNRENL